MKVLLSIVLAGILIPLSTKAQVSEQIDDKAKGLATPQQESWQQVDEINNETDQTKARYQQAKQQNPQQSGYSVKKTKIGTTSAYKKPSTQKKKTVGKQKSAVEIPAPPKP